MKKKILIALIAVSLVLALVLGGVGCYFVDYGIVRPVGRTVNPPVAGLPAASAMEKKTIVSQDGLELVANLYWVGSSSHRWLVGVHGYKGNKESYLPIANRFAVNGYNVLLPDLRAHGESEGKYIGMGWPDRLDLLEWIDMIVEIDPEAQIILHGTSMGGATVMMTAGEVLPDNVKGIIEDCGYTSVWDIFADQLDEIFGLPTFPILNVSGFVSGILAGYDFAEASAVEQLKKAMVPVLFIHGSEDDFVPTHMVYDVYEACGSVKELLVVEGAGHAESNQVAPKLYYDTVFAFIDEKCIPSE